VDAFDSDVLIYAAQKHVRGNLVARLIDDATTQCIGSVVLLSEVFALPTARVSPAEQQRLLQILGALDLKDLDYETAGLAGVLRGKYRLRTPDALHLATAILWGADRFHTNNRKDFGQHIDEIEIVLP
jgi:predicted nucleic acid-binding protein